MDKPVSFNGIKAMSIACLNHKNQIYRGGSYFENHIIPVMQECASHTSDDDIIVAAILHDIVEDTPMTIDEVKNTFGERIADLVWRVTNEPGKNRRERHLATYPKIKASNDAVLIKLCDRIINTPGEKIDMYRKEYPDFKAALYTPGVWDDVWEKLDAITYAEE